MVLARLEIVRKFRTSGVPGVHGDEDAAVGVALDHIAHEHEGLFVRAQRIEDRQHLDIHKEVVVRELTQRTGRHLSNLVYERGPYVSNVFVTGFE